MRKEPGAIVRFFFCPWRSIESAHAQKLIQAGWALDGSPTPGSQKFEFDQAQRDMRLKEPPRLEQIYDFSLLDEVGKRW